MPRCNVVTFTTNGTWYKSPKLYAVELVLRGAGGGGASGVRHTLSANRQPGAGGGGGGAVRTDRRISAADLPDSVDVVVGTGGAQTATAPAGDWVWNPGNPGGASTFGDILRAEGGTGGGPGGLNGQLIPGAGGLSVMRGGNGGALGGDGESVSSGVVSLLAGGGGGGSGGPNAGGNGGSGGSSGLVPQGWEYPEFWKVLQSGGGAPGGTVATPIRTPGFPAGGGAGGYGGGGAGSRGGHGLVTVIEYLFDE
ncbi:hypothetical protein [Rhodococcus koreensis]|uniref:glycine-rich domain-containing protein n=1 Tax=Rhodococcus koreensis TaxID=99653 RepID=UPI00367002B3